MLGIKDGLRGTAALNWARTLAMSDWDGVDLVANPVPPQPNRGRVNRLRPQGVRLDGSLASGLSALTALEHLLLDNNELTGSIPEGAGGA